MRRELSLDGIGEDEEWRMENCDSDYGVGFCRFKCPHSNGRHGRAERAIFGVCVLLKAHPAEGRLKQQQTANNNKEDSQMDSGKRMREKSVNVSVRGWDEDLGEGRFILVW